MKYSSNGDEGCCSFISGMGGGKEKNECRLKISTLFSWFSHIAYYTRPLRVVDSCSSNPRHWPRLLFQLFSIIISIPYLFCWAKCFSICCFPLLVPPITSELSGAAPLSQSKSLIRHIPVSPPAYHLSSPRWGGRLMNLGQHGGEEELGDGNGKGGRL